MSDKMMFMRDDYARKRGQVVTTPFPVDTNMGTLKYFIIVQVDVTGFDQSSITDPRTIRLKLDQLMKRFPDTEETYIDEDGNEKTRTVYGYFDKRGASTNDGVLITLDDLSWEGKDE